MKKPFRKALYRLALDAGLILLGVVAAGFGIKSFLLYGLFIDGGVTGISMLIIRVTGWPLPKLIILLNIPFVLLGLWGIGWRFAIKSLLAIVALAASLIWVPYPLVTPDMILASIFGGSFIGAGIGLAIRGGAVLDGTEIAALLISKATHFLRIGDVILLLNVGIFAAAAYFLGVEPALYSVLAYVSASKSIDFILHGIEEYTAITIMSSCSEAIRLAITNDLSRGVTVFQGRGGHSGEEQEILYCVVTRLEIGLVKNLVADLDEDAFVIVQAVSDAHGGRVKSKAYHA